MKKKIVAAMVALTSLATVPGVASAHHTTPVVQACPQWETMLHQHSPGWDINRMSRIMWRESRCLPHVVSRTRDVGLLQINPINFKYLTRALGTPINRATLRDPELNIRAAAQLYRYWQEARGNGYRPWRATA